jgi:hypothetical protein
VRLYISFCGLLACTWWEVTPFTSWAVPRELLLVGHRLGDGKTLCGACLNVSSQAWPAGVKNLANALQFSQCLGSSEGRSCSSGNMAIGPLRMHIQSVGFLTDSRQYKYKGINLSQCSKVQHPLIRFDVSWEVVCSNRFVLPFCEVCRPTCTHPCFKGKHPYQCDC